MGMGMDFMGWGCSQWGSGGDGVKADGDGVGMGLMYTTVSLLCRFQAA